MISKGMVRKLLLVGAALGSVLILLGYVVYLGNAAPAVSPIPVGEGAEGRPYVVKLHAQWCPVCAYTKDMWAQIEAHYAGRVNRVVLDFTNEANTEESRAEASRLGLSAFFNEHSGETGTIAVLDGRTKEVMASIHGSRDFAEYRDAVDAALDATAGR